MNIARIALASGEGMPRAALSIGLSRRSATHSMTDCQMASFGGKVAKQRTLGQVHLLRDRRPS
jgi:hypothetical protein